MYVSTHIDPNMLSLWLKMPSITSRQTHTGEHVHHNRQTSSFTCCLDLWHTATPQLGSALLYVSICSEHLWQMGDTLKSYRPLHFPKEQLPGTTNHSSVHFSSFSFFLPPPQAPASAGERFNMTHRCKWQNCQAHEKKKTGGRVDERRKLRRGFRYIGRWERDGQNLLERIRHWAKDMYCGYALSMMWEDWVQLLKNWHKRREGQKNQGMRNVKREDGKRREGKKDRLL